MKSLIRKSVLPLFLFGGTQANAFTFVVEPVQVATLQIQDQLEMVEEIKNVANQVQQIQQLAEKIDLAEITNDILGEYGLDGLAGLEKTLGSYEDMFEIESLTSMLDDIVAGNGAFDIESIFSNTLDGAFGSITAPDVIDPERYQSFATYESAYAKAVETSQNAATRNAQLGQEASNHRAAAASAANQAEYVNHINMAKAADAAIVRNNQESELALQNAELIKEFAESRDESREKAENDKARDQAIEENRATSDAFQSENRSIK